MRRLEQRLGTAVISDLREHPDNPNRGDVEAVVASATALGFWGALVVQQGTRFVLAGNTRLRALKAIHRAEVERLGSSAGPAPFVPVVWVTADEVTARRILAADNRLGALATSDPEKLTAALESVVRAYGTLSPLGYTDPVDQPPEPEPASAAEPGPSSVPDEPGPEYRQVILVYAPADHAELVAALEAIANDGETPSDTVRRLLIAEVAD
jgi:site-specific DNA-methyltransferase (adenine-specific)